MHYKDVKKIIKLDDSGEAPLNPIERELANIYPVGELGQIGYGVYICRGCA